MGFRQNPYGKFTVNVGVYVPELHAYGYTGGGKLSFIHEYDGWVRERLGILGPERQDLWWDLKAVHEQAAEVFRRIERDALPFLAKFETRDAILNQWMQGKHAGRGYRFQQVHPQPAEPCLCNYTGGPGTAA